MTIKFTRNVTSEVTVDVVPDEASKPVVEKLLAERAAQAEADAKPAAEAAGAAPKPKAADEAATPKHEDEETEDRVTRERRRQGPSSSAPSRTSLCPVSSLPMTLAPLERLPPHDIEAEEAVIASLMVDPEAMLAVQGILKAADFFREKNGWVYDACLELWNRDEVDQPDHRRPRTRHADRLEDVGGQVFLAEIIRRLPTSLGAEFYARIVKRDSTYRGLIHAATGILQMAYEAPAEIEDVFSQAEDLLQRLRGGENFRDFVHIRQLLDAYLDQDAGRDRAAANSRPSAPASATSTRCSAGLKRSDLVIVGARPSVGKSSFALGIARNAAIEPARQRRLLLARNVGRAARHPPALGRVRRR